MQTNLKKLSYEPLQDASLSGNHWKWTAALFPPLNVLASLVLMSSETWFPANLQLVGLLGIVALLLAVVVTLQLAVGKGSPHRAVSAGQILAFVLTAGFDLLLLLTARLP